MNITISKEDFIKIETVEHCFPNQANTYVRILSFISMILIFSSNGYLINILRKQTSSILDWIMLIDLLIGIINSVRLVLNFVMGSVVLNNIPLCMILNFFNYYINVCNKLITMSIAVYRYVFVVKHEFVQDAVRRQSFSQTLFSSIFILSAVMTGYAVFFKEKYKYFLSM